MLFAISGSQGQGKSTVLESLKQFDYTVVQTKTSRSILSDWNITLEEINSDMDLKCRFQDEVLNRHQMIGKWASEQSGPMFCERSYADIFAYALISVGPFNKYSSWLNEYHDKCKELQSNYSAVFNIGGRDIEPENDGVRSVNRHFADMVDGVITSYGRRFSDTFIDVTTPDHDSRINVIINYITEI